MICLQFTTINTKRPLKYVMTTEKSMVMKLPKQLTFHEIPLITSMNHIFLNIVCNLLTATSRTHT